MREVGMGAGPIPVDKIFWYLDRFVKPTTDEEEERWAYLIRRMDSAYLKATAPKKDIVAKTVTLPES